MSKTDIIIHDEKDSVGVIVVDKVNNGQECECWIMENNKSIKIQAIKEIPLGHKIALKNLSDGDTILKYGLEGILAIQGMAPRPIIGFQQNLDADFLEKKDEKIEKNGDVYNVIKIS